MYYNAIHDGRWHSAIFVDRNMNTAYAVQAIAIYARKD